METRGGGGSGGTQLGAGRAAGSQYIPNDGGDGASGQGLGISTQTGTCWDLDGFSYHGLFDLVVNANQASGAIGETQGDER